MKYLVSALVLGVSVIFFCGSAADIANAQSSEQASSKSSKGLKGVTYYKKRKRGGYSYKYLDGVDTRRFVDPSSTLQSPAGPFDSGFFFVSPTPTHGAQSPYMH